MLLFQGHMQIRQTRTGKILMVSKVFPVRVRLHTTFPCAPLSLIIEMDFIIASFIVLSVAVQCQAEVVLEQGSNETVTFDGDEVEITLQNSRTSEDTHVVLCFASAANAISELCPKGYLQHNVILGGSQILKRKVNRQGQLFAGSTLVPSAERIIFDKNGNLNIMIQKMSDGATVIMPKAEIYVPKKPVKETKQVKPNSNATVYIVIVCVVVFLVALILIGVVLYFCVIRKKTNAKPMPMVIAQEENLDEVRDETPEIPMSPVEPEIKIHTPQPSSPATPVTDHRTKGFDKVQSPIVQPASKAKVEDKPKTPSMPSPILEKKSTAVKEPVHVKVETEVPISPAKAETPESAAKVTTPESPVQKPESPTKKPKSPKRKSQSSPLPLDKTQSATKRRSPPTGTFGNDEVATALSENSHYNVRGYLKRSEASIPGSSRSRSRSRPLIVDEIEDNRLQTESYLCYAERMKLLKDHDHMLIAEHVDPEVQHEFSNAERALLKAAPADAPRLADVVVAEADKAIERFTKADRPLSWDEDFKFWDFINTASTPTSVGYIVMYRIVPKIFKLGEVSMADPLIRTTPLMGLYILLLDKQFPQSFRMKLASELRTRASRVFKIVQKDQMKNVAFPATYMMLAYEKNPKAFVGCQEIHSQVSKKKRKKKHRRS